MITSYTILLLSKAFDCLSHELVPAKLSAYEVDISTVCFIYDYLTNWKHKQINKNVKNIVNPLRLDPTKLSNTL